MQRADWCLDPLDYFVLARLESAGLQPSPPAERVEWLRRVSFDLVGLAALTWRMSTQFLTDQQPGAYERVVDRLLASPHFGERWASMWLDLARYADTTGYEADPHRDIWPYRDWVIRAFNEDMPYDEFTIKQLAGDLVDEPTLDDRLATAFHRNTQTNTEGGTDDEEFRVAAVIDRVNTTWQVWQATTFGCVQCHSHPYDPIRHEEYYKFMAFFDDTRDGDVDEDLPRLDVPLDRKDDERASGNRSAYVASQAQVAPPGDAARRGYEPLAQFAGGSRRVDREHATADSAAEETHEASIVTEVLTEGAVTVNSKFTIESPLPAELRQTYGLEDRRTARRCRRRAANAGIGICLVAAQGGSSARGGRTARGAGIQARVL